MGNITVTETPIEGVLLIENQVFGDSRGFFMESFNRRDFEARGLPVDFVQDNHSKSRRGVLRGLHFQKMRPQGKLVRAIAGEVYDVAVDIRPGSPTYGRYYGAVLSAENKLQLYVPPGLAHGFLVLSEAAEFTYKCTDYYDPTDEGGILYSDPDIAIAWPVPEGAEIVLSDKDQRHPLLRDSRQR